MVFALVASGLVLTIGLVVSFGFSFFILFTVISSQQSKWFASIQETIFIAKNNFPLENISHELEYFLNQSRQQNSSSISEFESFQQYNGALGTTYIRAWRTEDCDLACKIYGCLLVFFHIAIVYIVIGLHIDKFCAISAPLKYNQLVTRERVALYSCCIWMLSGCISFPALTQVRTFTFIGGCCLPAWYKRDNLPFSLVFVSLAFIIPFIVMIAVNIRILFIARSHQHRIFSAIFDVMMSAQATVTHHDNPFGVPKKRQRSIRTFSQQVGAYLLSYLLFCVHLIWESAASKRSSSILVIVAHACIFASPLLNSFLYGVKSKTLRKAFKNYLRKKLYKSEIKYEIKARVPSCQNSRRPSISSVLGMPALQMTVRRHMSDLFLHESTESPRLTARRSSDLSWHPLQPDTPSTTNLRRPINTADIRHEGNISPFLKVPTFETARLYYRKGSRPRPSFSSVDSDDSFSPRDPPTEEEYMMVSLDQTDHLSTSGPKDEVNRRSSFCSIDVRRKEFFSFTEIKEGSAPVNINGAVFSAKLSESEENAPSPSTPLLFSSINDNCRPINFSSPYVLKTLESIISIRLHQSLLRGTSFWRGLTHSKSVMNPNEGRRGSISDIDGEIDSL